MSKSGFDTENIPSTVNTLLAEFLVVYGKIILRKVVCFT